MIQRLRPRSSIAVRLSVMFALTSAVVVMTVGLYLHTELAKLMLARQQAPLSAIATTVEKMLRDIPSSDELLRQPDLVGHVLTGHVRVRLWVYRSDGTVLFASSETTLPREEWASIAPIEAGQVSFGLWHAGGRRAYRLAVMPFESAKNGMGQGHIVLAADVSEPVQLLTAFERSLFMALPAGMLAAALIGTVIARRELKPIARVASAARRLTARQLNERIEAGSAPAELQELVDAFNTMLARLEDSFRRLADFSADLAHELRTPLTSLLGRTQLALLHERAADEYRQTLESNIEEAERLSSIVSDMLFLAQADNAQSVLAYTAIDLRREVEDLFDYFELECEGRGIVLRAHGEAQVAGDRGMLRRALSNLLSNAIRHSPAGGRVEVELRCEAPLAMISVVDHGPGITPGQAKHVFDRFYRADPSRARESGGTGLGLAIVKSIAHLHGGEVTVESQPGTRTAFTLRIPSTPARYARREPASPASQNGPNGTQHTAGEETRTEVQGST